MIRQISLNCKDRGNLLQKIWNAYLELFQKVTLKNQHIQQKIEYLYITESTRIHQTYQKEIENFYLIQENLKKENVSLAQVALEMKEIYKSGKRDKKASLLALRNLTKQHEKLKIEYNTVMKTNLELVVLLETEKQDVEEKKNVLEKIKNQNEDLLLETKKISNIFQSRKDKNVDTQDLIHLSNKETNTEESNLFLKPFIFNKDNQNYNERKIPISNIKKNGENYGIFEEFLEEKEKYRNLTSTSKGFAEVEFYRLSKNSVDMKRRSTNYSDANSTLFNEKKFTSKITLEQNNKVIIRNDEPVKSSSEKKLPKYTRIEKKLDDSNFDIKSAMIGRYIIVIFQINSYYIYPKK